MSGEGRKQVLWNLAAVILLGALIGLAAGLLSLMLVGVESLALGYTESPSQPAPFSVSPLRRVLSVFLGLTVASIIWWFLRNRTTAVPSVMQAVEGKRMPLWQTLVHVVLQIFIVGCGASIGREVAPRELGSMLGQGFSDLFKLNADSRRLTVAVSAGAGLAAVYNAPLAGTFFTLEMVLAGVGLKQVILALGTSSTAAYTASLIRGSEAFYLLPGFSPHSSPSLVGFALFGGLMFGLMGAGFRIGSTWAQSQQPAGTGILWQMPLAGLLTGVVAIWVPQIMGNGRASAQLDFSISEQYWKVALPVLLVTFVAKAVLTLLIIRSGASGGVLQPGIALGATAGTMLGFLWVSFFPTDSVAACGIIGAAAFLAASQQAPLMAICLVMELTRTNILFFAPVGLAVAMSCLVSSQVMTWSESAISRNERKSPLPVVSQR